ncbi:hypothetical protein Ahia01_000115700 [Argonauta hians]
MNKSLMLSLIISILANSYCTKSNEAYYDQSLGYDYDYLHQTSEDFPIKRRTLIECASISLKRQTDFFSYNKISQLCKIYSPNNIITVKKVEDKDQIIYYKSSKWIRMYALSMGAGSLIYESLINQGKPSDWKVEKCNDSFCPNFFRHPIMDMWQDLPIEEVKLVIYKNQTAVVNMEFDGRGSTIDNWFSIKRLNSSPWVDLLPDGFTHFAIGGYEFKRRFYVMKGAGCDLDAGWLAIPSRAYCSWEKGDRYPHILYSAKNTKSVWIKEQKDGDSLAIFIQMKNN